MSERKKAIKAYIVENFLFGDDDGLEDDSSFLEKAILDSTGVLELVAQEPEPGLHDPHQVDRAVR